MNLFTKLFLSLFISIILSFTFYSIIIMNIEKEIVIKNLDSKIQYNKQLYTPIVSHILYEVDKEVMTSLLNSIYQDKEIISIKLIDFSALMNVSLENKKTNSTQFSKSEIELSFNNISLGRLEINYTHEYLEKHLIAYEKNIFTFSILLMLILGLILFFFINKFTSSIEKLEQATQTMAKGDFSKEIEITSNDEIGSLAYKFEIMRKNLLQRDLLNQKQTQEIEALNEEMFSTQKILIETLGEIVEKRYIDDPNHIKRVAQMSYLLAKLMGINEEEARILKIVSPMHDVGKIGISDAILLKPGKLTNEEFQIMKDHSTIGFNILKDTHKKTLDLAAMVAYEHHEKWDGTGYPRGIKEEEISIFGRITAIIDVYDALANKRCYKDAWSDESILEYIEQNSGTQFDPTLVKIFLEHYDEFKAVQNNY